MKIVRATQKGTKPRGQETSGQDLDPATPEAIYEPIYSLPLLFFF